MPRRSQLQSEVVPPNSESHSEVNVQDDVEAVADLPARMTRRTRASSGDAVAVTNQAGRSKGKSRQASVEDDDSEASGSVYQYEEGSGDEALAHELAREFELEAQAAANKGSKRKGTSNVDKIDASPAKKSKRKGRIPVSQPIPEGLAPPQTPEQFTRLAHAVRLAPALQHSASMSVNWATLQVLQDNTLLLASLVRQLQGERGDVSKEQADEWRRFASQQADRVIQRYTGRNDIASVREPYAELKGAWERMHVNENTSPFKTTTPSRGSDRQVHVQASGPSAEVSTSAAPSDKARTPPSTASRAHRKDRRTH